MESLHLIGGLHSMKPKRSTLSNIKVSLSSSLIGYELIWSGHLYSLQALWVFLFYMHTHNSSELAAMWGPLKALLSCSRLRIYSFNKMCKWCQTVNVNIKTFFIPLAEQWINCVWESVNNTNLFSWIQQFIQRLNLNWYIFLLTLLFLKRWNQHGLLPSGLLRIDKVPLSSGRLKLQGYRRNLRIPKKTGQVVVIPVEQLASANRNSALGRRRNGRNARGCRERRLAGRIGVVKTSPAARDLRNTVALDLRFLFIRPTGWGLNSLINHYKLHKASRKKGWRED